MTGHEAVPCGRPPVAGVRLQRRRGAGAPGAGLSLAVSDADLVAEALGAGPPAERVAQVHAVHPDPAGLSQRDCHDDLL